MQEIGFRIFEYVTFALEVASAAVIVSAVAIAALKAALGWRKIKNKNLLYKSTKTMVGRGILMGLELLIAADIIRTVCVEFNFHNIGLLGLVVVIRVVLGFTLEVEISGRWPWQHRS